MSGRNSAREAGCHGHVPARRDGHAVSFCVVHMPTTSVRVSGNSVCHCFARSSAKRLHSQHCLPMASSGTHFASKNLDFNSRTASRQAWAWHRAPSGCTRIGRAMPAKLFGSSRECRVSRVDPSFPPHSPDDRPRPWLKNMSSLHAFVHFEKKPRSGRNKLSSCTHSPWQIKTNPRQHFRYRCYDRSPRPR